MITAGAPIEVRVFCTADLPGSPQILHLYDDATAMESAFKQSTIADEFDHSFVYFETQERATAYWKNKSGPIQFCGSAAYGLAWLAISRLQTNALHITSRHLNLTASLIQGDVVMAIPSLTTQLIHADADGSLFFGSDTGIYLLHVNTPVESINYPWLVAYLEKKQLKNAHGFCVFGWQKENNIGKLRYFVPWYGRIEDHVTGSIHQYLTPLVAELFAVKEQSWTQLSALGGRITTRSENTRVLLSGQCRLANT